MKDLLPFTHIEHGGAFRAGHFFTQADHLARVRMPTGGDFIGDVVDFKQRGLRLGLGHKRADTLHAHQQAVGGHFTQRTVDGHAAETQLGHQFAFGWHAVMRRPVSTLDLLSDHLLHAGVKRGRAVAHVGGQRGHDRRSRHRQSLFMSKGRSLPEFTGQANVCICIYK